MSGELITNVTRDGHNFAVLLKCLKSGIHTYQVTFETLREKFQLFLNEDFRKAFWEGLK